jgi:hypothetical protein
MQRFVVSLLSLYLGISVYFSFVIAPILFKVLDKKLAGQIVSRIFPSYFWIGLITLLIVLVYFVKNPPGIIIYCLIIITIFFIIFQIFYVLPSSQILKTTNYSIFLKLHMYSVVLNISTIIINAIILLFLLCKH